MKNANNDYSLDLIQQIDIVDVFERLGYKIIKKGGSKPITLCPFHSDTNPSLTIYENQYHCFACGAHGNIFSIIEHTRNCNFKEAVNWIKEQYPNIEINFNSKKNTSEEETSKTGFEIAFDCYSKMDSFEYDQLNKFAITRGYDQEFFIQSEIFYAKGNKLISFYGENKIAQELLLEKNLLKEVAEPKLIDRINYKDIFTKDRVIFTLRDYNNKIVGFAGRATKDDTGEESTPKYLFTKELPKSKILYRLNNIKERCLKKKESDNCFEIYITEGTFDTLRLESLQFNAVSVLGSHITDEQVRVLADFIKDINSKYETIIIHIFLDTDSAGIEGAFKSIKNLLSNDTTRAIYIDVIVNKNILELKTNEKKLKDPDEIGKNTILNSEWLKNNTLTLFEFLMRYLCDKENLIFLDKCINFKEYYNNLDIRIKIALLKKLKNLFPYKYWKQIIPFYSALTETKIELNSDYYEFNIFKHFILSNETKSPKTSYEYENKDDFQLINNAVKIAKNSSTNNDVPIDDFTWDRIEKCADIFNIFFYNSLKRHTNLGLPMLAINAPKNGSEYRLKVMYSHEQLIMQQYVLNELLRSDEISDVDFERFIPAIRYDNNVTYTTGFNYDSSFQEIKEKAVSFAYQIDMSVMNGQYIGNRSMFRPYYECWKSFIKYISEGITKINKNKIYKVRLDIRKFYDCITRDSIRSALYDPICEAFKTNSKHFKIMLEDYDNVESKTEKVIDWICKELFSYKYIDPKSGEVLCNQYALMGIPQGPNLSAYIGNIVLLPMDKAILKYINKINSKKNGEEISVRYARYVDDMVIISENAEHLNTIKMIIVDELTKIGLDLSSKTDEAEEISKSEAYDWLVDERGGLAISTTFDLADDSSEDDLEKYDDFLVSNRKDILKLLRNMSNNFNIDDNVEEYIKVFFKTKEVKYNDIVRFCQLILEHFSRSNKLSFNEYEQLWKENISLSDSECMLYRSDIMYLSLIDAMLKILRSKPYDFMSDEKKKEIYVLKEQIIKLIKVDSIFEKIKIAIKKTNKNNTDLTQNEYLINLKLFMLLNEMIKTNEIFRKTDSKNSATDEDYYLKLYNLLDINTKEGDVYLKRWMYSIDYIFRKSKFKKDIGSVYKFVDYKKDEEIGSVVESLSRFHFAVSKLMSLKDIKDFNDIKGLLRIGNVDLIYKSDIFDVCLYLWFYDEEDTKFDEDNEYIKIAIYTLINIVPTHSLAEIIGKGYILKKWLFEDSENVIEYLKVPSGVGYPGVIGMLKDDNRYIQVRRIDFENYSWNAKNLEWTRPIQCSYNTESNKSKKYYYKSNANIKGNWVKIEDYFKNNNSPKSIVEVYEQLMNSNNDDIEKTVFSKDNIFLLKDKNEMEILSYKINNFKTNNIVAISNGNESVKTVDVPVNGSLYWKIGTVLYDALNFDNFILQEIKNGEFDNTFSATQMEYYSLLRLKGCWMSKNYISKSDNSLKRTVLKTLDELKKFDDTEFKKEFLLNCIIKNHFIRERMSYNNYNFKPGEVEHRLSAWAKNVIDKEYIRLKNIVDDINIDNKIFINQPTRRTSLSYICISYRLSQIITRVKDKEKDDWVVDALELLKSSLLARSVLLNIRMQVMERITSLNKYEREKFLKKDFPLDYLGINEAGVTILIDSENQINELKSIMENLFLNNNDERTIRITLIGWLLLLCWLTEVNGVKNYIRKGRINNLLDNSIEDELLKLKDELLYDKFDAEQSSDEFPFEGLLKFIYNWNADKCNNIYKILNKIDTLDKIQIEVVHSDMFFYRKNIKDKNKIYANLNGKRYDDLPAYIVTHSRISEFDGNSGSEIIWTQSTMNNNLVGISLLGNEMEELSKMGIQEHTNSITGENILIKNLEQQKNQTKYEESTITNINEKINIENENQEESMSNNYNNDSCTKEKNNSDSSIQSQKQELTQKNNKEMFRYWLDKINDIQNDNWEKRKKKYESLDRIALFQFEVDDSYQHPINEMCLDQDCDKLSDEIKVLEFKNYPYNWNPNTLGIYDHSLYSCAEFRRRKLLEKVFDACDKFDVDILLLPEYSVRPDTIIWIKNYIRSKSSENYKFSIWAGTLRIVPNNNLNNDEFVSLGANIETYKNLNDANIDNTNLTIKSPNYDWSAVLPIILNKKFDLLEENVPKIIIDKIKKYPALSLHEVINPTLAFDSTQFGSIIKSRFPNILFKDAIDDVIELICAEMFIITSPSNIVNFSNKSRELYKRFSNKNITENHYLEKTKKDIMDFGKRTSFYQDNRSGRTPIILVPAYTTRSIDYYVAGQAAYLSSGLTTVFCNAVAYESKGGSCFIGTDSWDNNNADSNVYLPDYSPYNGITPGIYKQFLQDKKRGALGDKEQALLICDINPDISFKGKPNPVSLGDTLELVAHLPIIESSRILDKNKFEIKQLKLSRKQKENKEDSINKQNNYIDLNKYKYNFICRCIKSENMQLGKEICEICEACKKCLDHEGCNMFNICTKHNNCGTCEKVAICLKDGNIIENIIKLGIYLYRNNFTNTIYDKNPSLIGEVLMSIGSKINSEWLIKRGTQYLSQHINNPQSWPPPTSIDWIWVDVDYNEYKNCRESTKNQWENYKIDIPTFTSVERDNNQ